MEKRYQVFVSSTYADLREERRKVIQVLMEMDCMPAGMELFPAVDQQQWDFIKRVIDDCDYYLLILGGRYGSMAPDGVSYTEKEYEYAIVKGLPVLALLHESPDDLSVSKSDIDPTFRERLSAFREKVATGRLVRCWRTAEELPGLVAISLQKTIKTYPAIGWVRADRLSSADLLAEINALRKEKERLLAENTRLSLPTVANLAGLNELFKVSATWRSRGPGHTFRTVRGATSKSWAELFALIAPHLLEHPSDGLVMIHFTRYLFPRNDATAVIEEADFQSMKIQLSALGLVTVDYSPTTKGGMGLFWSLTPRGHALMIQLRSTKHRGPDVTAHEIPESQDGKA